MLPVDRTGECCTTNGVRMMRSVIIPNAPNDGNPQKTYITIQTEFAYPTVSYRTVKKANPHMEIKQHCCGIQLFLKPAAVIHAEEPDAYCVGLHKILVHMQGRDEVRIVALITGSERDFKFPMERESAICPVCLTNI